VAVVFRVKRKLYCGAATDAFHYAAYVNYSANAIYHNYNASTITYTDYRKA
jgi:hypothetical protein